MPNFLGNRAAYLHQQFDAVAHQFLVLRRAVLGQPDAANAERQLLEAVKAECEASLANLRPAPEDEQAGNGMPV